MVANGECMRWFYLRLNKQKMERELYNLKTKILRSKHISDQLREELANDVFEIEKLVNKTNDIHDVSQRTYFFDCWRKDGVLHCKEIVATCEEYAILKFEKEFDDYGYDPPYVG